MTYLIVAIYVVLLVALIFLVLLLIRLMGLVKKAEETLSEIDEVMVTLNSDLPVIMENLKEVSQDARETSKITRLAIRKAKDQVLWMNMAKEAILMLLSFRKTKTKKGGSKNE